MNEGESKKSFKEAGLPEKLPFLEGVYQETITLETSFEDMAASFSTEKGMVLLLSGSNLDSSRYNILALRPRLEVEAGYKKVSLKYRGEKFCLEEDPFDVIQLLVERFKLRGENPGLPVSAGLFGYLSYDLKNVIEKLPCTCMDTGLPDLCLYLPEIIIIQNKNQDHKNQDHKNPDHCTGRAIICIPLFSDELAGRSKNEIIESCKNFFFEGIRRDVKQKPFSIDKSGFKSSFTKKEYLAAVNKIISYLKAGDIYQANLSQRFETGFSGDTYSLFKDLFRRNPASFFSYINAGDHTIVSTSPERFIRQKGRSVESRPIKGTIARGATEEQDINNGLELQNSLKDQAELTMIVDLMRNDISRVTKHGSVMVSEHKRLERYDNVFHLVSVVQGELEDDKTSVDLLRATFPGGSITGCPKIRSMEIIDELESVKRHVYTGSIGYISFHDTMDLSIAIRTATVFNNKVCFSVGGGIVYDSDPEKEFQETLDKGKTLMESLSGSLKTSEGRAVSGGGDSDHDSNHDSRHDYNHDQKAEPKAWINGKIVDLEQAVVSASSPGFQYGAGLFETICVKKGRIFRLQDHISRLNRAWEKLFFQPPPDISWKNVIFSLIKESGLEETTAAVKLLISRDDHHNDSKVFLAAFAREYVHRLDFLGRSGLDLVTYPHPRLSPIADYKTLNYLYYERAGAFAKHHGGDEAVILNPDNTVSETNTASMFIVRERDVILPESPHVLDGVTIKSVLTILSDKGYGISKKKIPLEKLNQYEGIILTNALMGAVKVLSVDRKKINHTEGVCSMINETLFGL